MTRPSDDVVMLPVDPAGDPAGRRLTAVLNAHLALERATRRRQGWMAALALLSAPTMAATVFPGGVAGSFRNLGVSLWVGAGVAWLFSLIAEVRWYRRVGHLTAR